MVRLSKRSEIGHAQKRRVHLAGIDPDRNVAVHDRAERDGIDPQTGRPHLAVRRPRAARVDETVGVEPDAHRVIAAQHDLRGAGVDNEIHGLPGHLKRQVVVAVRGTRHLDALIGREHGLARTQLGVYVAPERRTGYDHQKDHEPAPGVPHRLSQTRAAHGKKAVAQKEHQQDQIDEACAFSVGQARSPL